LTDIKILLASSDPDWDSLQKDTSTLQLGIEELEKKLQSRVETQDPLVGEIIQRWRVTREGFFKIIDEVAVTLADKFPDREDLHLQQIQKIPFKPSADATKKHAKKTTTTVPKQPDLGVPMGNLPGGQLADAPATTTVNTAASLTGGAGEADDDGEGGQGTAQAVSAPGSTTAAPVGALQSMPAPTRPSSVASGVTTLAHQQLPNDPRRLHVFIATFRKRLERLLSDFNKEETDDLFQRLQDYVGRNNDIVAAVEDALARADDEAHLYGGEEDDPFTLVDLEYLDFTLTLRRAATLIEQRTGQVLPPEEELPIDPLLKRWINSSDHDSRHDALRQRYDQLFEEQYAIQNNTTEVGSSSDDFSDSDSDDEAPPPPKKAPVRRRDVSRDTRAGGRGRRGGDPDDDGDDPRRNDRGNSHKDNMGGSRKDGDRPGKGNAGGNKRNLNDAGAGDPAASTIPPSKLNPTAPPFYPVAYPVVSAASDRLNLHYAAKEALDAIPIFSGKIEEFPGWKHVAQEYANLEGVSKLTQLNALKNKLSEQPKKLVNSITSLDPKAVDHFFALLDKEYGRPWDVVVSQRKRIRGLPIPKLIYADMRDFLSIITEAVSTLRHIGHPVDTDIDVREAIYLKIPSSWRTSYMARRLKKKKERTLPSLMKYLEFQIDVLYNSRVSEDDKNDASGKKPYEKTNDKPKYEKKDSTRAFTTTSAGERWCERCERAGHELPECTVFRNMSKDERLRFLKGTQIHFRCLKRHPRSDCPIPQDQQKCTINDCPHSHHPLLHGARFGPPRPRQRNDEQCDDRPNRGANHNRRDGDDQDRNRRPQQPPPAPAANPAPQPANNPQQPPQQQQQAPQVAPRQQNANQRQNEYQAMAVIAGMTAAVIPKNHSLRLLKIFIRACPSSKLVGRVEAMIDCYSLVRKKEEKTQGLLGRRSYRTRTEWPRERRWTVVDVVDAGSSDSVKRHLLLS
jgi:hypothetical protein